MNKLSVVVTGDATLDCYIARNRAKVGEEGWNLNNYAQAFLQPGGSLLLGEVIETVANKLSEQEKSVFDVQKIENVAMDLCSPNFHRSFAVWSKFDYENNSDSKEKVWRVEEFLGLQRSNTANPKILTEQKEPDLVVFDDANLGFRENEELWKELVKNEKTWILLKMSSPIGEGKLWNELYEHHAERLIVSLTVDDLRLTNVQVSRELSWEMTAQDLLRELMNTPSINSLFHCAHIIVSFGTTGAVLISHPKMAKNSSGKVVSKLIFDPNIIEGMWKQNHPGGMIGYNTCMTASLALTMMKYLQKPTGEPDFEQGVRDGLAAMRRLHLEGYILENKSAATPKLEFPTNRVINEIGHPLLRISDLKDALGLARQIEAKQDLLSEYIFHRLSPETVNLLAECVKNNQITEQFLSDLTIDLNEILKDKDKSFYDETRFEQIKLRKEAKNLSKQSLTERNLICLNRMLLEDAYSDESSKKIKEYDFSLQETFSVVDIHEPVREAIYRQNNQAKYWTILEDKCRDGMEVTARDIVLAGPKKVLKDVPLGQFGKLLTVDRHEIESLRSIRTLVNEYVNKETNKKPISIAVFGAPGSGKSFGIAQMANTLLPGRIEKKTFNLSQFDTAQDLWDALHQVRDISLSEKIPLIFWDEFDTTFEDNPLGWLRYFLAPMQDGEFQDGQITHPIGRAIFVFAGGTVERMDDFGGRLSPKEFKEVKGPDFVSRLKGFVNILGPNALKTYSGPQPTLDPYYIIRRAILLRSLFERETPQLFDKETKELQIDEGVLRAMLETTEYKHGVRSMESVIAMSMLKGKQKFERSSLPSEAQLNLHVDAKNFMELVNRINLTGDILETIALEIHQTYQQKYGTNQSYDELPYDEKEQNKGLANDIPNKLAKIGCVMTPRRGIRKAFHFKKNEIEMLAEMEHERWMRGKLTAGWSYASPKDKPNKLHDGILHWGELSETDLAQLYSPEELDAIGKDILSDYYKDIDCYMIEKIPQILDKANQCIVRESLVIGVTGHRILMNFEKIEEGIEKALQHIEKSFQFQSPVVMSSLAIGADTLVAQKVLERPGSKLIVPLPVKKADYETDFDTEETKQTFQELIKRASKEIEINPTGTRNEAYKAAGNYILENCDVLLTIWDGQEAQGQGGTGEIVALARKKKIPIAWIHAGNRNPETEVPTSLGNEQGKVTFENF